MPYAQSGAVRLYYEEVGTGHPIIFVHEFGSDLREWEAQLRFFSREYRCIAFNARGYPPSDVPSAEDSYSYIHSADDIAAVARHIGVEKAHIVGLSMGAYAALQFGLRHPGLASAIVVAGCGSGAAREHRASFKAHAEAMAGQFLEAGSAAVAPAVGLGATRIQLQNKDPRGWQEFVRHLSEHSAQGSALTLRNYQAIRPSLYDLEEQLDRLTTPILLAVGDEDEPCLDVNLFLKRTIPSAGLWMLPRSGHAINLEEPAAFNEEVQRFFSTVERGRWGLRDPRSLAEGLANPGAVAGKR
ncbi:alpha/beta fold hydrolase [Chelatococcus reniformis]|uniref:Alpha/beta hydrolase n=1 Tax=Chelatococcus reniformis TaxID=1494448 RepID=A0A916UX22_9HYPH|nr:alpha/beta hydrolase [Chelatococcus reniformis]GGC91927.1 alpha/beta hydrolase [Chelatococcus reniformis]